MMVKLSPLDEFGYSLDLSDTLEWIGNPRCESPGANENLLIGRRADLVIVASVEDPNASYSYDEAAVVRLDGEYFLVQTAGCSCPSPSETWGVVVRGTLPEVRAAIERGEYGGYTLPDDELQQFLADIDTEVGNLPVEAR